MKKRFERFGRSCPQSCKETCCFICQHCNGGIEFIPTRPELGCDKGLDTKQEGLNCPGFVKLNFEALAAGAKPEDM